MFPMLMNARNSRADAATAPPPLECAGGGDFPAAFVPVSDGGDCVVNGMYDRDHDTLVGFGVHGQ
jgi:hypothetical protein